MADVELVAIEDFSYATRRLKAGDRFTVREGMAKVLVGIKKAEAPRAPGRVSPPPKRIVEQAKESTPQPVPAMSTKTMAKKTTRKRAAKK